MSSNIRSVPDLKTSLIPLPVLHVNGHLEYNLQHLNSIISIYDWMAKRHTHFKLPRHLTLEDPVSDTYQINVCIGLNVGSATDGVLDITNLTTNQYQNKYYTVL